MAVSRQGGGAPDALTLAGFLGIVIFGGGNAPSIRYISCAECELDPFWGAAMRFLTASILFAVVARLMRAPWPRGRMLGGAALYGVFGFGAGFGLVYWGFVRAPAGLGQVLLAAVPLLTFLLAIAHRLERFRLQGLIGATVAIGGIAVVFSTGLDTGVPLSSMVAISIGALAWAEGFVVLKVTKAHPAAINAIAMGVGGAILLALSAIFNEAFIVPREVQTWAAQAWLVIVGSLGVFYLVVFVTHRWTASASSYQMVMIPLVTVPVSALLQDERITASFALGALLVMAGVYVGALWRPASRARAAAEETADAGA